MKKAICRASLAAAALLLSLGMRVATTRGAVAGAPSHSMQTSTIEVKDFSFQPKAMTLSVGAQVTWVNRDEEPHTIVSTDKLFSSKALDTTDQFSYTFSKPGTYKYFCSIHPYMVGTIVVKADNQGSMAHH